MSLVSRPQRLSEEINGRLSFTTRSRVDEHSLKRYQYSLESLRGDGRLDKHDYIALGKIYFNLGKYREFLQLMEEALRIWVDLDILTNYLMGKMMIYDSKLLPLEDFDVYSEWFDPAKNPSRADLSFQFRHDYWPYQGREFKFEKETGGNITLGDDGICRLEMGPFRIMEAYEHFKEENCDFFNHIFEHFLERLVLESATEEEINYFRDVLGAQKLNEIKEVAMKNLRKQKLFIENIPGLVYPLKKKIPVVVTYERGYVFATNTELDISLSAATVDEALSEFSAFFAVDFSHWMETPSEKLTANAARLKRTYFDYIEA